MGQIANGAETVIDITKPDVPSPVETSQHRIDEAAPRSYRPVFTLSEDELREIQESTTKLLADPDAMDEFFTRNVIAMALVDQKLAMNPGRIASRNGAALSSQARARFIDLAMKWMDARNKAKQPPEKAGDK